VEPAGLSEIGIDREISLTLPRGKAGMKMNEDQPKSALSI